MLANYPVDLHCHTVLSDGADSINELIDNAISSGLKVVALTDHDVLPPAEIHLPGGGSHSVVSWARFKGLALLCGVEFSCETGLEDVHIIGLGCRWKNQDLCNIALEIVQSKADAYQMIIKRLNKRGYKFSMDELLNYNDRKVELFTLQKKRIFDFMASKGFTADWIDAKLLIRDDPYLNVPRKKPSAERVIKTIHIANGIAILAHPYLIDPVVKINGREIERWEYIESLIESGLDGIEVRYTYNKTTCKDKRPTAEIWDEIHKKTEGRLITSGGSDYHADGKKKAQYPRELGECGLTMDEFCSIPAFLQLYEKTLDENRESRLL
jgi:predicted metal-dependent phosphoesterase TrpH